MNTPATPAATTPRGSPGSSGRPAGGPPGSGLARTLVRWALAVLLATAGVGHFASAEAFRAQVPPWMPWPEAVIAVSGVIELVLAGALVLAPARLRPVVGWVVAAFFVAIFPGNISQYVTGTAAFGLDSDAARLARLAFQPVLVAAALWSTGAWAAWRRRR
ncbi:membrane protein [Ornithinibacter aureus]|uniref:Membrane protein n=1 Tax=Ornithinibacter aureus TaxID=622664 RepID=A0ABP8JXL3_9MICO|nr:hypothetical protein [Ornithinibacter aureus]KAF0834551.1 putative membrane protein [Ornithinibacter aureus]